MLNAKTRGLLQSVLTIFTGSSVPPTNEIKRFKTKGRRIINDEVRRSLETPGYGWLRAKRHTHVDERQIELFPKAKGSGNE